jgi:CheY-like chemotaxis protein
MDHSGRRTTHKRDRRVGGFVANMSHELRTPLNVILGYAQILKMTPNLDERQLRGIDAIRESGEHMLHLVTDMLDLACIEAGRLRLMPASASLGAVMRYVSHHVALRAGQKGLAFESRIGPAVPPCVLVDEKRLCQALSNLLGNAVKFTDDGAVSLYVDSQPIKACTARLRFEVADTGRGIPASHLDRILQPFEQACPRHQRREGAGLGLAIASNIVRLMGGELHVHSEVGLGSRFWFELDVPVVPATEADRPTDSDSSRNVQYDGPRRTVLVVDDTCAHREVTAQLLELLGLRPLLACDGQDALDTLQRHAVDLVVMDAVMPGVDGLTATRRIRQTCAKLPVIMVSASSYDTDRRRAFDAGADAFLAKPLDFNALRAQIGQLLGLSWRRAERGAESMRGHQAAVHE